MILERWDIPFWPQYPSRSWRENFLFQFLASFPGLQISDLAASFDHKEYARKEKAYRDRLERVFLEKNFLSFEPPSESALGYTEMKRLLEGGAFPEKRFVKLQITGPGTIWRSFFRDRLTQAEANPVRENLLRTLTAAGLAQIERVRSWGRRPFVFIDEPLPANSFLGLDFMIRSFKDSGALAGLHVCSHSDWENLENLGIDFFHFDLSTQPKLEGPNRVFLHSFLKKKKGIAWGVVPTAPGSDFGVRDFSSLLLTSLQEISDSTLSLEEILSQSLLAPACGTGTLMPEEDEAVFQSLQATRDNLKISPLFRPRQRRVRLWRKRQKRIRLRRINRLQE